MTQPQKIANQSEAVRGACAFAAHYFEAEDSPKFQLVESHSNFNYVFKVVVDGECYYLKVAQPYPKTMSNALPRERIFAEAYAMNKFRGAANGRVSVPDILSVDTDNFCFLMTDVNEDQKCNGLDLVRDNYTAYRSVVKELSSSIGRWHAESLNNPVNDYQEHAPVLREFIYSNLIEPGIVSVVGRKADLVISEMKNSRMCLIHSDLWAKNYLISETGSIALLDFEGAILGDPGFDLATMIAASLLPVFQYKVTPTEWLKTVSNLIVGYRNGLSNGLFFESILSRLGPYLAIMISARTDGPFAYSMKEIDRSDLNQLCSVLVGGRFDTWDEILEVIMTIGFVNKTEYELI